jgi:hypothetical protein
VTHAGDFKVLENVQKGVLGWDEAFQVFFLETQILPYLNSTKYMLEELLQLKIENEPGASGSLL